MTGSQPSATHRTRKVCRGVSDLGHSTQDILRAGPLPPPPCLLALSPLAFVPLLPPTQGQLTSTDQITLPKLYHCPVVTVTGSVSPVHAQPWLLKPLGAA